MNPCWSWSHLKYISATSLKEEECIIHFSPFQKTGIDTWKTQQFCPSLITITTAPTPNLTVSDYRNQFLNELKRLHPDIQDFHRVSKVNLPESDPETKDQSITESEREHNEKMNDQLKEKENEHKAAKLHQERKERVQDEDQVIIECPECFIPFLTKRSWLKLAIYKERRIQEKGNKNEKRKGKKGKTRRMILVYCPICSKDFSMRLSWLKQRTKSHGKKRSEHISMH